MERINGKKALFQVFILIIRKKHDIMSISEENMLACLMSGEW